MRRFSKLAALTIGLGLAACAREEQPVPASSSGSRVSRPQAPNLSASSFVMANASIDLFVIRSSELALQRSSSARLRDFASKMIEAHKGTSAQLSFAGRRLNLLPSATLRASEQAMLDRLQTTPRFDAEYLLDQRLVHQQAIVLDRAYAASGRSPTLRPVAAAALPIEQGHLRLIAQL